MVRHTEDVWQPICHTYLQSIFLEVPNEAGSLKYCALTQSHVVYVFICLRNYEVEKAVASKEQC